MTFWTIEIEYPREELKVCPMEQQRLIYYIDYSTHMNYSTVVHVNVLWCRLWCGIATVG
jgi:hypothetical protein